MNQGKSTVQYTVANRITKQAAQAARFFSRRLRLFPFSLTLSVTSRCNLHCKTCNIWQKKEDNELTFQEYDTIFSLIKKRIAWVTIDGGEPFLRDDIDRIIHSLYTNVKPQVINIATNATLPRVITGKVQEILRSCPGIRLIVNVSLDAVGGKHDELRGTPGTFAKVLETFHNLKSIQADNFSLGINTTASKFNIDDIARTIDYCVSLKPHSYLLEIAEERDKFDNLTSGVRPDAAHCIDTLDLMLSRIGQVDFKGFSLFTGILRKEYYRVLKRMLQTGSASFPCLAGCAFGHIMPDGKVWTCCVKNNIMGDVRKEGYDFRKLWFSRQADQMRSRVRHCGSRCTSANVVYCNMMGSTHIMPRLLGGYLSWKKDYAGAWVRSLKKTINTSCG